MTPPATDPSTEVTVMLILDFKEGGASEVLRQMVPEVRRTREEEGCIAFDLFRVDDQPDRVVVFERWRSQADLDLHWRQDYTRRVLALFEQTLLQPPRRGESELYLTDVMAAAARAG